MSKRVVSERLIITIAQELFMFDEFEIYLGKLNREVPPCKPRLMC